jgi:lipopolysaccharide transport system permease protein
VLREMWDDLCRSRELAWRLILRDLSARYRQSFLGYLWAVFPVLLTTLTFTMLRSARVLSIEAGEVPYPLFVLIGATVWQLFAGVLTAVTQSLAGASSLLAKVSFPRVALLLAALGLPLVEFAIRLAVLLAAFRLYGVPPAWGFVLLPLALIPLCALALGLGGLTALANAVARDAGSLVTLALTFWMFVTPVVYPIPQQGTARLFHLLNPVSPFVVAARDLSTRGALSQPELYAGACLAAAAILALGWWAFHSLEPRIAERI